MKISIPGNPYYTPTVQEADDATLADCLAKDVEALAAILDDYGQTPGPDGLPTPAFMEKARIERRYAAFGTLETLSRRVPAIREEQARRGQERKEKAAAEQARARANLQRLVEEGPAILQQYGGLARDAGAAVGRVRQFVADVAQVGALKTLRESHSVTARGIAQAAKALGVPVPHLPELPDDCVTPDDVEAIAALIFGRHGGWSQVANAGDYGPRSIGEWAKKL